MEHTISEPRARLRDALHPMTATEHTWTDWLISNLTPDEAEVWIDMVERRERTAVRAAVMALAGHVLDAWVPIRAGGDEQARMEHAATGGGAISRGTTAGPQEVADAYDLGWREGIEHAQRQQSAGVDPELWRAE